MTRERFGRPLSSCAWKAPIAGCETQTPFEFRVLMPDAPDRD